MEESGVKLRSVMPPSSSTPMDDGYFLPTIKPHSLEKIRRHNYYAALFSKAMSQKWPQRLYVGLYSGAGKAAIESTNEVVETSALAVLRQEVPFTKCIFVDADARCLDALRARVAALGTQHDVTFILGDVGDSLAEIKAAIPPFSKSKGLLSLCFIDPFGADFKFQVIRELSNYWMDFLITLPLGMDLRRNLTRYLEDPDDRRVAEFIDQENWRDEWRKLGLSKRHFVRFLLERFDEAMTRLGYRGRRLQGAANVRISGMGVFLYALTLYSRHELGETFWRTTLNHADNQLQMDLDS